MDGQTALLAVLRLGHRELEGTVADCDNETLHAVTTGATVTSIASIYAHAVISEDFFIHRRLQDKPMLFETGDWSAKTGVPTLGRPQMDIGWAATVHMDLPSFRQYAQLVYEATEAYLQGMSADDIDRKVQSPTFGEQTVGWYLATIVAPHPPTHAGEIAALKGLRGLKGLPF